MKKLLTPLLFIAASILCGCVYHQPFTQGNVLSLTKTRAIHAGMSSEQVVAQLGSPVLQNMYADNRMTYVYTNQPTRNTTEISRFIVRFQNDRVAGVQTDLPNP